LLVNTRHFWGTGDSTYTLNLAELLHSKGHEVVFFAMQDRRNLPDANDDLFVSHIDFRELSRHKNLVTGFRVLERFIYSTEARRKFSQMLDRFMPDIVHLQTIHAHITPSVILEAKKHGLPVVWTLHDYKLICPNAFYLIDATGEICEACGRSQYYQPVLNRCKKGSFLPSSIVALEAYAHRLMRVREHVDTFLAPSIFLRNKYIEKGFSPGKVHQLPHFLRAEMFQTDYSDRDEGYLLFLANLKPYKGIRPLLEACRLAPEIRLILAGQVEEPLASRLPTILPPNAHYVGMKHGEELLQLLHNALAVILPSLVYECQPFTILEAFACGKPVVASDLGGMTELVKASKGGLLVPPGDVQALAKAMRWMATHFTEAREMGHSAREYAREKHGAESHYEQIIQIYAQAMKGS
jgi:glycosyltransferase involved in cell wall biosynthesis